MTRKPAVSAASSCLKLLRRFDSNILCSKAWIKITENPRLRGQTSHLVQDHVQFELDAVSLLLTDANLLMKLLAKILQKQHQMTIVCLSKCLMKGNVSLVQVYIFFYYSPKWCQNRKASEGQGVWHTNPNPVAWHAGYDAGNKGCILGYQ